MANLLNAEQEAEQHADAAGAILFSKIIDLAKQPEWSKSFSEEHFHPGDAVFLEGEWGDRVYLILSGRIAIIKGDFDAPTILAFRNEGEIIGEMALLENQPRSASVIALDRLRLLSINRHQFEDLLHKMPLLSMGIMEILSSRLRKTDEALTSGDRSEKQLIHQVSILKDEKQTLEELHQLQRETSELIIHDLRNPLSNIAVSLDMLSKALPSEALETNAKIFEIAQNSLKRMKRLVDTLLEVARIESGESQFIISEVDFHALLQETIGQFSALERKNIDFQFSIPSNLALIPVDRDKVERILINLIDNCLKYSPPAGVIKIDARMVGDQLYTSINDQGPGIPEEDRERIFERFAQITGERRIRRGFGLGLPYCRLAVEGHGGRIWVETGEEGIGSRFIFTLPVFLSPIE